MTSARCFSLAVVCMLGAAACDTVQEELSALAASPTAVTRAARLEAALADSDAVDDSAGAAMLSRWVLPPLLQEISGLALTTDGRLLVHNDELATIWEIDYRKGLLTKRFAFGKRDLKGDFEGITVANDVVYVVSRTGKIHEFREGANGAQVDSRIHDLGLKDICEFESVAFDSAIGSLLLACKKVLDKAQRDSLVIYRWSLAGAGASRLSRLTVPLADIIGANDWKKFHPSDISVDPLTGNYVIVASIEKAIISITPAGIPVFARPLPSGHAQAEGLAITKDGILIVSDEADTGPATITLYKWR